MARRLGDNRKVAKALQYLSYAYGALGKKAQLESACLEWLEIAKKVDPGGSIERAEVLGVLALVYGGRGELDRQESLKRQSAEMYKKFGNGNEYVANALSGLAHVLESRGKLTGKQ